MLSINTFLRQIAVLSLLVVLAACQFVPTTQPGQTETAPEATPEATPEQASVNPYLQNRPAVSDAVVQKYQRAKTALLNQQWDQAEQDLQWLTENHPGLSGPYVSQAWLYFNTGQMEKVEPAFQQAIAVNSNNVSAYNQYAIFLRQTGNFAGAETLYQQSLAIWPDYPEGHLNLGILYDLYMGKLEPALAEYQAYQDLQSEPDRQVAGWIVDTQRRLKQAGQ